MIGRIQSIPHRRPTRAVGAAMVPLVALALALAVAAPAGASTDPSRSERRAIKQAFLEGQDGKATIRRIRLSTVDQDFAAVFFKLEVSEPTPTSARVARTVPTDFTPPPVILKQGKGRKWKTVPKAPAKVEKDLKVKARKSSILISGDFSALLTRPASCTESGGFYTAGIYDPAIDLYLSIQIPQYVGHGWYPARAVGSVAGLYSDSGTVLRYETGLAHDATAPSGDILAEAGWGFIGAGMARTPPEEGTESNTVTVSGVWECR
jgi:hypothetical protein